MRVKHLNDNRVTVDLGLSVGTIAKSRGMNRDLSSRNLEKILNFYTDLSRVWLMTGDGEMLTDGSKREGFAPGDTTATDFGGVNVESMMSLVASMMKQNSELMSTVNELIRINAQNSDTQKLQAQNIANIIAQWQNDRGNSLLPKQDVG